MNAKELLVSCRDIVRDLKSINHQISFWGSIGGPRELKAHVLTGMPKGTNRPDAAENQQADRYGKVLLEKRQDAEDLLLQFEQLLDTVPDRTDRAILRYYYGSRLTDEKIAEEIGLSDKTVRERRKKVVIQ